MKDLRLEKLAKLLLTYSLEIKPGDNVYIIGQDVSIPLIKEAAEQVVKLGAIPQVAVVLPEVEEALLVHGSNEQITSQNDLWDSMAEKADAMFYIWGDKNTTSKSRLDPKKISLLRTRTKNANRIMDDREELGAFRWVGTQFPTQASAQDARMSLAEYENFVFNAGMLHLDDPSKHWLDVADYQNKWVKYLNTKNNLHFKSSSCDFTVGVSGRNWISCDGKVNFPDGEIFTSPIEDSINGHVTFSYPAIYGGNEVEGVTFVIENGKIIKATADEGEEYLNAMLDTDDGARYFGEIAIGTNYAINEFTKNLLFDEKIGGTIHMAAGNSLPTTGGKNKSAIHWDLISDMNDGEISADGEVFYKNGRFLDDILK